MLFKNIVFLTLLLALPAWGKKLQHLETVYQTCCPETYILNMTTMTCQCPPERHFLTKEKKCVECAAPDFWDDVDL